MKLFDVLPKLCVSHRDILVTILRRALSISMGDLEVLPSLDNAFNLLGRHTVRRDMLRDIERKIQHAMGTFLPPRIDDIHGLIELCDKQIGLVNEMIRAILMKEIPYVEGCSKGMDVRVQLKQ